MKKHPKPRATRFIVTLYEDMTNPYPGRGALLANEELAKLLASRQAEIRFIHMPQYWHVVINKINKYPNLYQNPIVDIVNELPKLINQYCK